MFSLGGMLGCGALSAAIGTIFYANLPTRLTIGALVPTVDYLAEARLKLLEPGKEENPLAEHKEIMARDIFQSKPVLVMAVRRPGCAFCRKEAAHLCSINEQLAQKGVRVIGVVHEALGVSQFRPFLKCADSIYLDTEKRFFGPQQRWLPLWMGFLRLSTYVNLYKTKQAGVVGNMEGEGRLLGGVYLVNKGQMLYAHLEQEWGDEANLDGLLAALEKI